MKTSISPKPVQLVIKFIIDDELDFSHREAILLDDGIVFFDAYDGLYFVQECSFLEHDENGEKWLIDFDNREKYRELMTFQDGALVYETVANDPNAAKALAELAVAVQARMNNRGGI